MKILVINTGSSSIKYKLIDLQNNTTLASGLAEKIAEATSRHIFETERHGKTVDDRQIPNHRSGMSLITEALTNPKTGVIQDRAEISAVGHRVVHGGEEFTEPVIINPEVIEAIRKNIPLAPLHNPANIIGIECALSLFPDVTQVAVFDTAFHQSMPAKAFRYALPKQLYQEHHIRRYGFHGTSHFHVAKLAADFLDIDINKHNLITVHLGNGASICAIESGKSVDTSMGLTPLEGLVMGTRSGDIDPAIIFHLVENLEMDLGQVNKLLNKQSGLKGLAGTNDLREVIKKRDNQDQAAKLAIEIYCYRIKKYIGAYCASLGNVDAIIFTAGVGENSAEIRARSLENLANLGIILDLEKNSNNHGQTQEIQADESRIKILVVPTNEELEIAVQAAEVINH
jgi:acetate kinase